MAGIIAVLMLILSTGTAVGAQKNATCAKTATSTSELIACAHEAVLSGSARCEPAHREALASPVAGRRVLRFGELTQFGGASKGDIYQAADSDVVHAPASGVVTFAGEFRSYGTLLIIDACDLVVLVAGTGPFEVAAGQSVTAGEEVARMQQRGADLPVLYLEVQKGGVPIDPAKLLAK